MTLLHLATTTSTMDVAKQLVEQGDTATTMVLADEQTAARGRHNRPWQTFGSSSLMCTWILRPAPDAHLPLIVALALYDAILPLLPTPRPPDTPTPLQIKWPNDLLLNGKKLAGILCQNVGSGASTVSLVGIGLNISQPETVPESFLGTFLTTQPPETPTSRHPKPDIPTPDILTSRINTCLQPLVALYNQQGWTESLHNSYLQRCATIGKQVHWIRSETEELTGLVRGLTPNGHLELVAEDGTTHVIHSGEIFDKR